MRYSKVFNLRLYNGILHFILKNRLLIILTVLFVIGFSYAVFSYGDYEYISEYSQKFLSSFILKKTSFNFFKCVTDSFLSSMFFIIICFICGASMLGVILVPLVIIIRGFLYGCITAFLYSTYSFEGVAFHAVLILPIAVIFTVVLIFCSVESIGFSCKLVGLILTEKGTPNLFYEFKRFAFKLLIYSIFVLISAFIEVFISKNLLNNFSGII